MPNDGLVCPQPVSSVNDPGTCGARVIYDPVIATDNCNVTAAHLTQGLANNSVFPVGRTEVVYTSTDTSGNANNCSFPVQIRDNERPTIGKSGMEYSTITSHDPATTKQPIYCN